MLISPSVAANNCQLFPSYYSLPSAVIGQQDQLEDFITMMRKFQPLMLKPLLSLDQVKSFINLRTELSDSFQCRHASKT